MRRFEFRLRNVQRVRQTEETIARGNVRVAQHHVAATTGELERRRTHLRTLAGPPANATVDVFLAGRASLGAAAATVVAGGNDVAMARAVADTRVQQWRSARGRVRALERLEARRRDEHELEVARDDVRETDELILARRFLGAGS
ncbi:MAG: hypothetical protein WEC34_03210 [Acidimicrobiia bacterium]